MKRNKFAVLFALIIAIIDGGCDLSKPVDSEKSEKSETNAAKVIFSWHAGALNALIPVNASLDAGLTKLDKPNFIHFGTSSGAIVAALLSTGHSFAQIKQFSEESAAEVFGLDKIIKGNFGNTAGSSAALKARLNEIFGPMKMKEVPHLHILAARDGKVVELSKDSGAGEFLVADAVLASASIPRIFGHQEIDGHDYFDAGTLQKGAVNDPTNEAVKIQGPKDRVFSIANGFRDPLRTEGVNFTLLKGPSQQDMRAEMDDIPIQTNVLDDFLKGVVESLIKMKIPQSITPKELLSDARFSQIARDIDRNSLYSAMSNKASLEAFERLGKKMAQENRQAFADIAALAKP